MSENDENIKKAKQAADMVMLQNKAKDFQDKMTALGNKEYQGRYQGLTIKMKGDHTLLDVSIDQGFYETAGKSQIEKAILVLCSNLNTAIKDDQEQLQRELQGDIERMQKEAMISQNGNY